MKPFDPDAETRKSRRKLPHWEQVGCTYFVTFRLADSLAQVQLREWEEDLRIWKEFHPPPWDTDTQSDYDRRFTARIHDWLDAGSGSCVLARPDVREIVIGALRHFHGERYDLDAFVVMPNHVHVLVAPKEPMELGQIRHAWKSFTAHGINRLLGRTGAFWHDEGFDHIVRDAAHLERFRRYIVQNPVKAKLRDGEYFLDVGEASPPVAQECTTCVPLVAPEDMAAPPSTGQRHGHTGETYDSASSPVGPSDVATPPSTGQEARSYDSASPPVGPSDVAAPSATGQRRGRTVDGISSNLLHP